MRTRLQAEWNQPRYWPMLLLAAVALLLGGVAWRAYSARERATGRAIGGAAAPRSEPVLVKP